MNTDLNRRNFLRGLRQNHVVIRPPWALLEAEFIQACSRCDACIQACETHIIKRGDGGFPEIDFQRGEGECSFCRACVEQCKDKALPRADNAWPYHVSIDAACVAKKGVECRICGESCEPRAIQFQLTAKSVAQPILDIDLCTFCGACMHYCPVKAIHPAAHTPHPTDK